MPELEYGGACRVARHLSEIADPHPVESLRLTMVRGAAPELVRLATELTTPLEGALRGLSNFF